MKMRLVAFISAVIAACAVLCSCDSAKIGVRTEPTIEDTSDYPTSANTYNISESESEFAAELFKAEFSKSNGENTFISPLSVYTALGMLNNGAVGDTKSEIESVLREDSVSINFFVSDYMNSMDKDKDSKLSLANSVWVMDRDDVQVQKDFTKAVEDFFKAELFNEPITSAVDRINKWVDKKTDGMIDSILKETDITPDTVAVLLNAVAFDGKWSSEFDESATENRYFNNYDGTRSFTSFMSSENFGYINDGNYEGFIKNYKNGDNSPRYGFIAIMPNESIGMDKYIGEYFNGDTFRNAVESVQNKMIYI